MPVLARRLLVDGVAEGAKEVDGGLVDDAVGGVEPEAIDMIFTNPVKRVFDEEATHIVTPRTINVDGIPPGGVVAVGEVIAILREVVAFWPKMVIDNVQQDGQTLRVTSVDQPTQTVRAAVGCLGRVEIDPVIAPVTIARELSNWHQLDRGYAQIPERGQHRHDTIERAGSRERSHVELVDHERFPRNPFPATIGPVEGRVDDR